MILSNRKKPGRKKRCATHGCHGCRLEDMRFCAKCVNRTYRAMESSGYLVPHLNDVRWLYDNGLRRGYT